MVVEFLEAKSSETVLEASIADSADHIITAILTSWPQNAVDIDGVRIAAGGTCKPL